MGRAAAAVRIGHASTPESSTFYRVRAALRAVPSRGKQANAAVEALLKRLCYNPADPATVMNNVQMAQIAPSQYTCISLSIAATRSSSAKRASTCSDACACVGLLG